MELYRAILSPGENTLTSVTPANIDDSVPMEEEAKWAVKRLQGHRSGAPPWICAEHLQEWLWEHWSGEVAREAEITTSDPEEWEIRGNEGGEDGGEEREKSMWERVMELI